MAGVAVHPPALSGRVRQSPAGAGGVGVQLRHPQPRCAADYRPQPLAAADHATAGIEREGRVAATPVCVVTMPAVDTSAADRAATGAATARAYGRNASASVARTRNVAWMARWSL